MWHLLRHRAFRLLLSARLCGQVGDGLLQGGLVGYSLFSPEKQATAWGIAAAFALIGLPYSVIGPFAGLLVDRLPRRRVIAVGNSVRALLALGISTCVIQDAPYALLLPLVLIALAVNRLQLTAHAASIACTVTARERADANALVPTLGSAISAAATVAAPILTKLLGDGGQATGQVILIAGGMWVAAAVTVIRIGRPVLGPHPADGDIRTSPKNTLADANSGISGGTPLAALQGLWLGVTTLQRVDSARRAVLTLALHRAVFGFTLLLTIMHARATLSVQTANTSLALVAIVGGLAAAGTLIGALAAPRLAHRVGPLRTSGVGLLLAGTALPIGWWGGLTTSHVWFYSCAPFIGITYAAIRVGSDTTVQSVVADGLRGRVFSIYDILMNTSLVLGLVFASALLAHQGFALLAAGIITTAAAIHLLRSDRTLSDAERSALRATL